MDKIFEQIVEKMCSTLDLQAAFAELQPLLKEQLGIDGVFLGHHVRGTRQACNLVYADSSISHDLNHWHEITDELRSYLMSPDRQELNVFPSLSSFPDASLGLLVPENHTLYELRLRLDGEHIGILIFHTALPALPEKTLHLLMKIRAPIALGLANRLHALNCWPLRGTDSPLMRVDYEKIQAVPPDSALMRRVYEKIKAVGTTDATLLLTGETGVGKEVYARHIHAISSKKNGPFIHVNCGGITDTLIDSELFGYKKGAFTGALSDHAGLFEQADKGTIFLDEIGELPLPVQARLLLVLQGKTIRRVGDTRSRPLNIRIIAATNCVLEQMCQANKFREDLLYRLNAIAIHIPPLRERPEDIPALARHLLNRAARDAGISPCPEIPEDEMRRLAQPYWGGNVRELANCLMRSLIFSRGHKFSLDLPEIALQEHNGEEQKLDTPPITIRDSHEHSRQEHIQKHRHEHRELGALPQGSLNKQLEKRPAERKRGEQGSSDETNSLQEMMRTHMERMLEQTGGRIHGAGGAAELLGLNPSTLRSRLRKLGVSFGREKTS